MIRFWCKDYLEAELQKIIYGVNDIEWDKKYGYHVDRLQLLVLQEKRQLIYEGIYELDWYHKQEQLKREAKCKYDDFKGKHQEFL